MVKDKKCILNKEYINDNNINIYNVDNINFNNDYKVVIEKNYLENKNYIIAFVEVQHKDENKNYYVTLCLDYKIKINDYSSKIGLLKIIRK